VLETSSIFHVACVTRQAEGIGFPCNFSTLEGSNEGLPRGEVQAQIQ
jgi:hypothetical protein